MKRLGQLLAKLSRRAQKSASLEEALLTERGLAYVWYRARFLLLRIPFGIVLHAAEVIAFSAAYELDIIGRMLTIRSLPVVASALWWGALEALRERVRRASSVGEWGRAERAVRSFLGLAVDASLVALALAFVYVEFIPSEFGGFDIFDAYALACSLRFGLETLARTYHAGIFALRRVYRPWWSLLVPDVCELGVALILWEPLGPWGFSISTLVGGAIGAALQAYYSRAAYAELGRFRPSLRRVEKARTDIERRDFAELARHALANLAAHVDALLVLLLTRSVQAGLPFVVLLHAGRPLFSAVGNYARLFYFDFQRLELGVSRFWARRFARIVSRFAALLAGIAVALTLGLYIAFATELGRGVLGDVALLAAYVGVRSLLALEQIRLFTSARYRSLAIGASALVLVSLVLRASLKNEHVLIAAIILSLALLTLWFHSENRTAPAPQLEASVGVLRWLEMLRTQVAPVELGFAVVDPRAGASVGTVEHALANTLRADSSRGAPVISRVDRRALVWFHAEDSDGQSTREHHTNERSAIERRRRLLEASAGCIEQLSLTGPHARESALDAALTLAPLTALQERSRNEDSASSPRDELELRTHFREHFPNGEVIELQRAARAAFLPTRTERAFVARSVFAACAGRPPPERRSTFPRVAVYCPNGEPRVVFLAPSNCDASAFRGFRERVETLSFRRTITPSAAE